MMSASDLDTLKKKAYLLLNECTVSALEKGEMTVEDSEVAAESMLRNVEGLEGHTELLLYVSALSQKYPVYKSVFVKLKQEETGKKDTEKMEALQAKIRQFMQKT